MQGIIVEFRIESHTANVSSWQARTQRTHQFLSRESVVAALTYTDWLEQRGVDYQADFDPDFLYGDHERFYATPALPVQVRTRKHQVGMMANPSQVREVQDREDYKGNEHQLSYGFREFLQPGSTFRALVWASKGGSLPENRAGGQVLIGKERAEAVLTRYERVGGNRGETTGRGAQVHPIEAFTSPRPQREEKESELTKIQDSDATILRVDAQTNRYRVLTVESPELLQFGEFVVPAINGVTT